MIYIYIYMIQISKPSGPQHMLLKYLCEKQLANENADISTLHSFHIFWPKNKTMLQCQLPQKGYDLVKHCEMWKPEPGTSYMCKGQESIYGEWSSQL